MEIRSKVMIFAVVPFDNPPENFIDRIKSIDPNAYISQEPKVYFVKTSGNSQYVAKTVGFTNTTESPYLTGIVIPCGKSYSGFAAPDLWDYLASTE